MGYSVFKMRKNFLFCLGVFVCVMTLSPSCAQFLPAGVYSIDVFRCIVGQLSSRMISGKFIWLYIIMLRNVICR